MIITQKKPVEEVMAMVADAKTVAIVGCGSCATACQTGGEQQIAELTAVLEQAGKKVVATTVADYCCMNLGVTFKRPRRNSYLLNPQYVKRRGNMRPYNTYKQVEKYLVRPCG